LHSTSRNSGNFCLKETTKLKIGLKIHEGWSTLGLLALMLLIVAWSINSAEWTEGLAILQWVVLVSLAIGLVLAKSRLPVFVAHFLSLISGTVWVTFLVCTLLPFNLSWTEKLLNLADRLTTWFQMALGEESSLDSLIFVLALAALFWLLSYLCAWSIFRSHRIWGVIIPSGVTMLANLYYGPPRLVIYLIGYLLCALLLIVRSNVSAQEKEWQEARVGYQPDIGFDFLRYGAILSVIIVLFAWLVPTAAASPQFSLILDHFEGPWQEMQDHWRRLFASLNYQGQASVNSFGKTMTLSGPVSLSNTPIMDVRADRGYYWRAVVYDKYTSSGWVNTDDETLSLDANSPSPPLPQFELRREVTQTIRPLRPGTNLLFGASQPIRVSLPARIELSYVPSSVTAGQDLSSPAANISILHSRSRLKRNQVYTFVSSVTRADVESLRSAGTEYPTWVTARYLQLPPTLPNRVRALAEDLTKDYDNPYDKATALEGYLRTIPYNELINAPPPGQDGVDYFLFDKRQGYCDYYASALAVMARAVGIPARLASGYTRGEYHSVSNTYRVIESNAHTWVEVYFPRYGWVEFEPTASQPLIARPEPESSEDLAIENDFEASGQSQEREEEDIDAEIGPETVGIPLAGTGPWSMALWGGGLVLLVIGGVTVSWYLWTRGSRNLSPVERIHEKMARYAQLMGIGWAAHKTPYEYAAALVEALPQGRTQIVQITDFYVKERFSSGGTEGGEIEEAKEAWRALRPTLWQQIIRQRLLRPHRLLSPSPHTSKPLS
jgi:transglutaminase-like putative cysteine protease